MITFVAQAGSGGYWERLGSGRQRYWPKAKAEKALQDGEATLAAEVTPPPDIDFSGFPAVTFENVLAGRSRYNTYGASNFGEPEVLEDYADPTGAKIWKDYRKWRDPKTGAVREGPRPFRSKKERLDYERLTGQRQRDPTEKVTDQKSRLEQVAEKSRQELKTLLLKKFKE